MSNFILQSTKNKIYPSSSKKRGELSLTTDYLSEIFKSAYTDTISEWQKQGLSDDEIIEKLNQDTINNSLKAVLDQAAKDYREYFIAKKI